MRADAASDALVDEPAARAMRDVLRQAMVVRIATLSRNGRPSVSPINFVYLRGHIWIGTVDWTLAARDARADPRVVLLFEVERSPGYRRVLRITGRAQVRTDAGARRAYNLRAALKYMLTPGGIRHYLGHLRLLALMRHYHAQSAERGRSCIIDVTPEHVEYIPAP
jgi:hypothetical protein